MTISSAQKTDIINQYVVAIKARREIREQAQKRNASDIGDRELALKVAPMVIGKTLAKKHKLPEVTGAKFEETYVGNKQRYTACLTVTCGELSLRVPAEQIPALKRVVDLKEKQENLKKDLCKEIVFLSELLENGKLSSWGTYAGRRLDLAKDQKATELQLRPLIEDFVQSCRPVVCKI